MNATGSTVESRPVPFLRCEGLRKRFGGVMGLDGVTFDLPESGLVAIIGPNGAGKTTLIDVISGFTHPDAGRITFAGQRLLGLPPRHILAKGIARTFQDLRLIRNLTALENVLLACPGQTGERIWSALSGIGFASQESVNRDRSFDHLDTVGLARLARRPAGTLSYGEQKLLTLACLLATEARVLLIDEPVAGVHPRMVDRIIQVLMRLWHSGRLIVFIEHDLVMVQNVAERVLVMDHGQLICDGESSDVLSRTHVMEAFVA